MPIASPPDDDDILREVLDALDMPRSGVVTWLDHLERFSRKHGAERRYGQCLALVDSLRGLLAEPPVEKR